jgi:hypothetical protein
MRAVARIARGRKASGKRSVFRIRGRQIDLQEIVLYFRRRGVDIWQVNMSRASSPTPSAISCHTPAPTVGTGAATEIPCSDASGSMSQPGSAHPRSQLQIDDRLADEDQPLHQAPLIERPGSSGEFCEINPTMPSPEMFRPIEFVLFLVRDYCQSPLNASQTDSYKHKAANGIPFRTLIRCGSSAACRGDWRLASKLLNQAFSMVRALLADCPLFMLDILELISHRVFSAAELILAFTLRYISQMSSITLGELHPITLLTTTLWKNLGLRADVSVLGLRKSLEIIKSRTAKPTWEMLDTMYCLCEVLYYHGHYAEARDQFAEMVKTDRDFGGACSWELCISLIFQARCHWRVGEYEDARRISSEAWRLSEGLPRREALSVQVRCRRNLEEVARFGSNHHSASAYFGETANTSKEAHSVDPVEWIGRECLAVDWSHPTTALTVQPELDDLDVGIARFAWRFCDSVLMESRHI